MVITEDPRKAETPMGEPIKTEESMQTEAPSMEGIILPEPDPAEVKGIIKMPSEDLDRKIRSLLDEILILDSMIEDAITEAVEALKRQDMVLARTVYLNNTQRNNRRFELENDVIITIATEQPIIASDLRFIASVFEVVGELERMGDYAKGIAKIALLIGKQPLIKPLIDIPRMAELTVGLLHRAVGAFANHDVELTRAILLEDDQVEALYNNVYRELVEIMIKNPTTSTIDQANQLM